MEKVEGDLIRLVSPKKFTSRCTKHKKNLKLYCETCGELICRDCIVHIHKDHKYCLISDTFESHKDEILISLEPVDKQLEVINAALLKLDSRCDDIATRRVNVETEIHTVFDEIRKTLEVREAELVAQLEGHTQQQLKKLSAQREEVEILQIQRESCVRFVRESIRSGSPGDVLKMKAGVVKQVRELVDTFDSHTIEPCEQATASFIPSARLYEDCREIGTFCKVTSTIKTIPTKRMEEAKPQVVATLALTAFRENQEKVHIDPACIEARLVSRLIESTTKCVVTEQSSGDYEISYQPTVGGAHQLHIRAWGKEVGGSPFPVTVKTPVENKLGTVIKTIKDVKRPWGVAVNKSGEVIVAEKEADCVLILSSTGDKLRTLDTRGTAVGGMKNPHGVAVDSEDNILVIDASNCRLLKFSRAGDLIAAVGREGHGPGQFMSPMGVCVNKANGKVYVVDYSACCVHILNSDLTFSNKFGSKSSGNGCFLNPHDITSDSTGCVYVADYSNHRVQVFTSDGGYLRQFGNYSSGMGKLRGPASICADSDGLVYVGENGRNCVSVFTSEGKFLNLLRSGGPGQGQFERPLGIAVGGGVVYVSDYNTNRVQLF